ncbi:hypothetical protein J6590_102511 [Homalodisca vitripennis]|nr:hypothetical protein J6590_003029 [Homalodisca vitripennis]KAG8333825.1 hypothetical protein J6590_102511 [Homalodisca vitripennis]
MDWAYRFYVQQVSPALLSRAYFGKPVVSRMGTFSDSGELDRTVPQCYHQNSPIDTNSSQTLITLSPGSTSTDNTISRFPNH